MSQVPCGAKTTERTKSLWPWKVWRHLVPVGLPCPAEVKSQSLSVLSSEPDAKSLASGENDTEYTESLCPSNFSISFPVFKSHNLHSHPRAHTHTQTHTNMSVRTHRHVSISCLSVESHSLQSIATHTLEFVELRNEITHQIRDSSNLSYLHDSWRHASHSL